MLPPAATHTSQLAHPMGQCHKQLLGKKRMDAGGGGNKAVAAPPLPSLLLRTPYAQHNSAVMIIVCICPQGVLLAALPAETRVQSCAPAAPAPAAVVERLNNHDHDSGKKLVPCLQLHASKARQQPHDQCAVTCCTCYQDNHMRGCWGDIPVDSIASHKWSVMPPSPEQRSTVPQRSRCFPDTANGCVPVRECADARRP